MDENLEIIIASQRAGLDLETASHHAGVSIMRVLKLIEDGEIEQKRIHEGKRARKTYAEALEFFEASVKAKAETTARLLGNIQRAGADDWKASKWLLGKINDRYSDD